MKSHLSTDEMDMFNMGIIIGILVGTVIGSIAVKQLVLKPALTKAVELNCAERLPNGSFKWKGNI